MMEIVIKTQRLILRKFTLDDAAFMLKLLNTPTWLRFIGDRNVKTLEEAEQYLLNGNIRSYQEYGFGFYVVVIKETQESIGICGIVKREGLEDWILVSHFSNNLWERAMAMNLPLPF